MSKGTQKLYLTIAGWSTDGTALVKISPELLHHLDGKVIKIIKTIVSDNDPAGMPGNPCIEFEEIK